MLDPRQCRAGRALLGWSRARLAKESGISEPTIVRFERGDTDAMFQTVKKLRRTLERAGVVFVDASHEYGPGVLMKDGRLPSKR